MTEARLQHATDFCGNDSSLTEAVPSETEANASTKDTRLTLVSDETRQPEALAPTSTPTEPLSMRWAIIGADGRLDCTWEQPTPSQDKETEDTLSLRRTTSRAMTKERSRA